MAINNIQLVRFKDEKEVNDIREMGELEIAGAVAYITSLVGEFELRNFGERCASTSFEKVNDGAYYCNKRLHLNDNEGYILDYQAGKEMILDHVFMRENSKDTLWGFAYWLDVETDEESDMFLVRI